MEIFLSDVGGRSAGSQGYASRGRAPAGGAARGRQAPASQGTYVSIFPYILF